MHKKFEVTQTKIKGGCQPYTKAAPQQSWRDLTLTFIQNKNPLCKRACATETADDGGFFSKSSHSYSEHNIKKAQNLHGKNKK